MPRRVAKGQLQGSQIRSKTLVLAAPGDSLNPAVVTRLNRTFPQDTRFDNSNSFFAPTVAPGTVTLTASLFSDSEVFYAATVSQSGANQTLTASLFTNSNTFYGHTVAPGAVNLAPSLLTNSQTFYSPTVSPGAVNLAPSLYTNSNTIYAATVTTSYTLTPSLYTNSQSFFAPTVTTSYTLTPSLFTNSNTFYSPTVTGVGGGQTLLPGLYTNTQTFYGPTVTPGAVTLAPSLFTNSNSFFGPTVTTSYGLTPGLYTNTQTFYASVVTSSITLLPSRLNNSQTFYNPTVAPGAVNLTPARLDNSNTFYAPTVANGGLGLVFEDYVASGYVAGDYATFPASFSNNQFFAATVTGGMSMTITAVQASLLYQIYLLHGLDATRPMSVGGGARSAGPLTQTVSGTGPVTISTAAMTGDVGEELGTMIEELAALHGLTADLVTTATSRTAGSISQTFSTSGATTTVTRQ